MLRIRTINNSTAVGEMSEAVTGQVVGGDAGAEVWECVGAAMCWVEGREGARARGRH